MTVDSPLKNGTLNGGGAFNTSTINSTILTSMQILKISKTGLVTLLISSRSYAYLMVGEINDTMLSVTLL